MADALKALPNRGFAELMTAVLDKGKPFRFQAAGASMSPFIRGGDVITLAPVHDRIHFGEVLAFRQPENDRLAVHRVVGRGRRGFLLKGDNGCHCDGWVTREKIMVIADCSFRVERIGIIGCGKCFSFTKITDRKSVV